uniref:Major facilitator superfamily (MFS) profile domain-containing protein n=1 Tax=Kwoniella bestiolae CBS 10118 TaxID=1296100 RepID=A0A1B9FT61_9TREE|nr:hypothetical protein I302_08733 [Kwoniella bestiolae CBS 10118]OCF21953.1 hypothetical protein I302_08733 [Kwoniella bestiolae CBS 10118]
MTTSAKDTIKRDISGDEKLTDVPSVAGEDIKDDVESPIPSDKIVDEDPTQHQVDVPVRPLVLSRLQKIMLGGTISVTYFMMSLSVGSGLLIIPVMADYFNVSVLAVQWVTSAYQLAYGWLVRGLLVSGRLADLYGRKKLYLLGMLVSSIANIISGVIPNRIALTVFRAIAGLGLSISAPAGFGIIGTTFREEPSRTMAFAALGVGTPLGAVVGEVIGGLISGTGRKGWQYLYFLIAGFGILPIITGIIYIPSDDKITPSRASPSDISGNDPNGVDRSKKVDWIGAGLITVGLSLLLFSVTQAGLVERGWKTPYIPPVFSISAVMIILFGIWEYHLEHRITSTAFDVPPIVRLSVFTRHKWRISAILGIAFFDWMGVCGWVYLTSVYYQDLLGYSPLKNAVYILPAPITGVICSYLVTLAAPRISAPILLALGGISTGLANALFAFQPPHSIYWGHKFFGAILQPFGGDLTIPIGSVMISNLVDE